MTRNRIFITGLGMIAATGIGIDQYTEDTAPREIQTYSTEGLVVKQACAVAPEFSIKDFSRKIGVIRKERMSQLTVAACVDAATNAGLTELLPSERIGLILSTEYGPTNTVVKYLTQLEKNGAGDVSPNLFTQTVYNVASGQASIQLQTKGVSSTLVGCSSISYALDLLQDNRADIVLAAGVDELSHGVHSRDEASGVLRPDSGFLLGEGCGVVVLEREDSARKRQARILGELIDCVNLSAPSMKKEYSDFNETGDDVFYKAYYRLLKAHHLKPGDISCVSLADNGVIKISETENASLDRIGFQGKRAVPKKHFGEAYGADEQFAVIHALKDPSVSGKVWIDSLYVNGNACVLYIEKGDGDV